MNLETVKVRSRNEALRGKVFDVYFEPSTETTDNRLISIEDVNDAVNLIDSFDKKSLNDVAYSLRVHLHDRAIQRFHDSFTQEQHNANFVKQADENRALGYSND